MHEAQKKVNEFHRKFNLPIAPTPRHLPDSLKPLFYGNIKEETRELETAIDNRDLIETADALVDLIYVVYGMAAVCGIDIDPLFDIVHASNMSKEGGGKNAVGKPQKPKGWVPPTDAIATNLSRQIMSRGL